MSSKIVPSSGNSSVTSQQIPQDVLLRIFMFLDLAGHSVAPRVCKLWAEAAKNPALIYGQYLQIKTLDSLSPQCSGWEWMPQHWKLSLPESKLHFSSICPNLISFSPLHFDQSSKFFSFTQPVSFTDDHILLAHQGNLYFLIPPSQDKLLIRNIKDPSRDQTLSLPAPHKIHKCFPLSENRVVVMTTQPSLFLWSLESPQPVCTKEISLALLPLHKNFYKNLYKVGNYLIINSWAANQLINLTDLSVSQMNWQGYSDLKIFDNFICGHKIPANGNQIGLFVLQEDGLLEKKWEIQIKKNSKLAPFQIEDMNKNFIILTSWNQDSIQLLILSTTDGEQVSLIEHSETSVNWDTFYDLYFPEDYPIFAQISDDILIFKHPHPLKHTLYFYHIPTKKQMHQFQWTQRFFDLPLFRNQARVQDVRFADNQLTILLSYGAIPQQFRMVQFDLSNPGPSQAPGMINWAVSIVKNLYNTLLNKGS